MEAHFPDACSAGCAEDGRVTCTTCFRHCTLAEGQTGFCHGKMNRNGQIVCSNYGLVTALALDPIEKKPLARFRPGSRILSVGSFGCNLRCPFCQNDSISCADQNTVHTEYISPEELCRLAVRERARGNIGAAFTYNEAMIGWEYVRDCAKLIHEAGLVSVLVTNGCVGHDALLKVLPWIDAMNIDLKSISPEVYRDTLGGSLAMTQDFIRMAVRSCHVELTELIVPGMNDSDEEMEELCRWIASLHPGTQDQPDGADLPLHISRFFPRHDWRDREPTPVRTIYHLAAIAGRTLRYVYPGNC